MKWSVWFISFIYTIFNFIYLFFLNLFIYKFSHYSMCNNEHYGKNDTQIDHHV